MGTNPESPLDLLWKEYGLGFRDLDDLTLARWLAQTLGQIAGRTWRLSHPLLGAYRLAAQLGHERQIWLKRLVATPADYSESPCCRAPMLPLLTRDVNEAGLICQHCSETLVPFDEVPLGLKDDLGKWASEYAPIHAVAHWDDRQRKSAGRIAVLSCAACRKAVTGYSRAPHAAPPTIAPADHGNTAHPARCGN